MVDFETNIKTLLGNLQFELLKAQTIIDNQQEKIDELTAKSTQVNTPVQSGG